jgi:tetratricopeptide (TPR) repeat protein
MVMVSGLRRSERTADVHTVWEYARTQFGVVVHYLRLSVWPDPLCLDYQWPVARSAWEIAPPAAFIGALVLAVLCALWRWPRWGFLGAAFFLTLAPSSSVIPIPDLAFEHRMYLPLASLAVVAVLGGYSAGRKLISAVTSLQPAARLASVCLVAGIAAVLGILTYLRNDDYRSELRIWQDTVAKASHNFRAHNNLGRALAQDGRTAEAVVHYQRALEINPDYVETNFNFGLLLVQLARPDEAIPRLEQVLKIRPKDVEAHLNLGVALAQRGRNVEAIGHYQEALAADPICAAAHNNLGNVLLRLGRVDQAVLHYRAAVDIDPADPEYRHNLGVGLRELGKSEESRSSKPALH